MGFVLVLVMLGYNKLVVLNVYPNSILKVNTLYKVLKSTFGAKYDGDIILELEEINEPSLQKFGISIHSQDGRSVRIKRENISLEIKQIAQKL